jgi:hypothetical protein
MVRVAEDGANSGRAVTPSMSVVAAESGVTPTYGTLLLIAPATTWYAPRFISEQLIKIQPGMKFSFDIFLSGVVNGNDAVAVQPSWYMKNGTVPPRVVDQNGLHLSQRPRDGMFFMYNDDLPYLGGRATNQWYHREFDLSALAGNYVDGIYLTEAANRVNVGAIYVDNIRFTWPGTAPPNASPTVALTSPASGAAFTAPATINLTATAGDTDGTVSQVSFYAGATLLGTSTTAPYAFSWTNVAAGSYTLTAVARDNANATTTSSPVTVTVSVAPPPPSSITPGATYIATDTTTSGNWKGVFGTEGYMLAGDATSLPAYATAQQTGSNAWTWTTLTADTRALLRAATTTRFAATWYGSTMDLNVNVADGLSHRVSLYLLDWDARGRAVAIDALDTVTGAVLDTRSVSSFAGGTYVTWALKGRVTLRVKNAGLANAVYSAVFFDPAGAVPPPPPPPPPPAVGNTAVFVASDATTRGNWKGVYGASGFSIPNDGTTLPAYATLRVTGAQPWTWASWTADTRALQKSVGPDRIASTWYGNVAEIEVTITDGNSHDFSVYFLDWDARSRAETVQVLNADTGAVLDSRPMSAFGNGVYLKWTISGHVKIRISWTSGANMVFNGLFFDR